MVELPNRSAYLFNSFLFIYFKLVNITFDFIFCYYYFVVVIPMYVHKGFFFAFPAAETNILNI